MSECPACNGPVCSLSRSLFDESVHGTICTTSGVGRYADWSEVHAGHFTLIQGAEGLVVHRNARDQYCIVSMNGNPMTVYELSVMKGVTVNKSEAKDLTIVVLPDDADEGD